MFVKYIGNTQICLLYLHFQVSLTGLKQKTFGSLLHDSIYQKSKDQTILSAKKTRDQADAVFSRHLKVCKEVCLEKLQIITKINKLNYKFIKKENYK